MTRVRGGILALSAAILAFAYFYNYWIGFLRFNPLDTSIVYDAGFRVFHGQVPFRDFYSPVGPFLYWAVGLFFRLFGAHYVSFVALASCMNALITACALAVAWRLRADPARVLAAGFLTALWAVPIGVPIPWYNGGGALLVFAALWLLAAPPGGRAAVVYDALAGLLIAAAFYTKQQYGAAGGVFFALYLLQTGELRRALVFSAGCAAGLAAIFGLMIALSDFAAVVRFFLVVPATSERAAAAGSPAALAVALLVAAAALPLLKKYEWPQWLTAAAFLSCAAVMPFTEWYHGVPLAALAVLRDRRERALLIALTMIQFVSGVASYGDRYQYWYFNGLIWLLVFGGLAQWFEEHRPRLERLAGGELPVRVAWVEWAACGVLIAAGLRYGLLSRLSPQWLMISLLGPVVGVGGLCFGAGALRVAWFMPRKIEATMARRVAAGLGVLALALGAGGLAHTWASYRVKVRQAERGELAKVERRGVRVDELRPLVLNADVADSIEKMTRYLKSLPPEKRPFYVHREYLILHGLAGQVSPQPFLWLESSLTYQEGGPDEELFCRRLRENSVRTIVLYADPAAALAEMKCLDRWLREKFRLERRIGEFIIYTWNPA